MDTERTLADELRDAERRIAQHPGHREHVALQALDRSIADVFMPNRNELLSRLEAASTDWRLAFELVQNVRESTVRDEFYSQLTRHLYNYLASSASLVEHVRWLLRGRTGHIVDEFRSLKGKMLQTPEVWFVFGLRNYAAHRKLPFFAHTFSMTNVNKADQKMESEVQLNVTELLEWDEWSSPAQGYLEGLGKGEAVTLRPVIKEHAELVLGLNVWLLRELGNANANALDEVNELVIARNAILTGGDLDAARRMAAGQEP